jgi:hypothetical protein
MEIPLTKMKPYHSTGMPHFEVWIARSLEWNSWIEGRGLGRLHSNGSISGCREKFLAIPKTKLNVRDLVRDDQ